MASLKISSSSGDRARFIVHYRDETTGYGRRATFREIGEAAHFFWERESVVIDGRTSDWDGLDRSWTLQKLLYFFLGHQFSKLERGYISQPTYKKCQLDILAVSGAILEKNVRKISNRDIEKFIRPGGVRWLRSAFNLLIEKRLITFNPVEKAVRRKRKPIIVPSKSAVRQLLDTSPRREQIAAWFGICGMRIGEVLAVTYADISSEWIHIRRHVTGNVICDGLKRGVERRIRMPSELFNLLDKNQIGTARPIICHAATGSPLSINYGTQGKMQKVLTANGIKKFHHLRHFCVSRLAERGVDIVQVSRLVGHTSIKTTVDIYGHLFGQSVDMDL